MSSSCEKEREEERILKLEISKCVLGFKRYKARPCAELKTFTCAVYAKDRHCRDLKRDAVSCVLIRKTTFFDALRISRGQKLNSIVSTKSYTSQQSG